MTDWDAIMDILRQELTIKEVAHRIDDIFIKKQQDTARDIICMMEDRPAGGGWIKVLSPSGVEEVKKRYGI